MSQTRKLMLAFTALCATTIASLATGAVIQPESYCNYLRTECGSVVCAKPPGVLGHEGQHIYQCTIYPYTRPVTACCGN